ncbi:hypothetical protein IWX49DRAFT_290906 [Phyllosticta citricarpa]|uniref:Uncharacterized protein n=1 Tax=Phyllosticta citricarpa TaxID=55181 RepID=A0ABR1MJS3_9PEZI
MLAFGGDFFFFFFFFFLDTRIAYPTVKQVTALQSVCAPSMQTSSQYTNIHNSPFDMAAPSQSLDLYGASDCFSKISTLLQCALSDKAQVPSRTILKSAPRQSSRRGFFSKSSQPVQVDPQYFSTPPLLHHRWRPPAPHAPQSGWISTNVARPILNIAPAPTSDD